MYEQKITYLQKIKKNFNIVIAFLLFLKQNAFKQNTSVLLYF